MNKFLTLKNKLINSKRESQKIDEQQLNEIFKKKSSLGKHNKQIGAKIKAKIYNLTQEDYKLKYEQPQEILHFKKNTAKRSQNRQIQNINTINNLKNTMTFLQTQHRDNTIETAKNTMIYNQNDIKNTIKKQTSSPSNLASDTNFASILQIMSEINKLQKLKFTDEYAKEIVAREIGQKLKQVKCIISHIQNKNLIDFNNEPYNENSPDSFNSQNSDETYQQLTERQAYELNQSNNYQEISINYRRVSQPSTLAQLQTATQEQEQENTRLSLYHNSIFNSFQSSEQLCYQSPRKNDKNIIHLFSYQKSKYLDSQLSKISQRQSQYQSISQNHKQTSNSESLQFKKIRYLLQTTEKKDQEKQQYAQISQFSISNLQEESFNTNEDKKKNSRSKCHEQLQEMIFLLENKYKRKIRVGASNIMDNLNDALKDKKVHLRSKRLKGN